MTAKAATPGDIDREMESLISKMVRGVATESDRNAFSDLSERRSRLMYPVSGMRLRRGADQPVKVIVEKKR